MAVGFPQEIVERAVKVAEEIPRDLLQFDIEVGLWSIHDSRRTCEMQF